MSDPKVIYPGSKHSNDPVGLKGRRRRRFLASTLFVGAIALNLYLDGRQIAPGQQELRSYIEQVSRDDSGNRHRLIIPCAVVTFLTSGTTFATPTDWNNANNSIECIGGGGGGETAGTGGGGGGGGAYAKITNLTMSGTITIQVGGGGAADTAGTDTKFNVSSVIAKAGLQGAGSTGGLGGSGAGSTGATKFSGGNGGDPSLSFFGAGGGAAGKNGAGNAGNSSTSVGGSGDAGSGGAGGGTPHGNGGNGTEYDASHGSGGGAGGADGTSTGGTGGLYGGGGSSGGVAGGPGRQGLIVVTYTVAQPTVTAVSPNHGPPGGGTVVTLTGTAFINASSVSFGGTNGTSLTVNSSISITITSPAHATGIFDVTVTTPLGGTSANNPPGDQFTFDLFPHFAKWDPGSFRTEPVSY